MTVLWRCGYDGGGGAGVAAVVGARGWRRWGVRGGDGGRRCGAVVLVATAVWAPNQVWGDGSWGLGAVLGEIPAAERGYDGGGARV